jgi:hypothetical protein
MKYGLEGYGLYWYCLELIAADVDQHKLTFELEHDAEIIAFDTGIHYERVNEMMAYMVNLKLFESNNGVLSCIKLASRLDKSMTSNPVMRKMLEDIRNNHDKVMTQSDKPMQDKTRLEENRVDNTKDMSPMVPQRDDVKEVFNHWKLTMDKSGATKLDSKRTTAIKTRLSDGYTVDQIKTAIINCSLTPHNMGQNNRGQKFNDIELICRNASNLERFIESTPGQASQSTDFSGQQSVSNWADGLANEFHGVNK